MGTPEVPSARYSLCLRARKGSTDHRRRGDLPSPSRGGSRSGQCGGMRRETHACWCLCQGWTRSWEHGSLRLFKKEHEVIALKWARLSFTSWNEAFSMTPIPCSGEPSWWDSGRQCPQYCPGEWNLFIFTCQTVKTSWKSPVPSGCLAWGLRCVEVPGKDNQLWSQFLLLQAAVLILSPWPLNYLC